MQNITSLTSSAFDVRRTTSSASVGAGQQTDSVELTLPVAVPKADVASSAEMQAKQQQKLAQMLEKVNKQMEANNSSLRFKQDDATGEMVITIYDSVTSEVIRQIPTKQALNSAQQISEFLSHNKTASASASYGNLLNSKA